MLKLDLVSIWKAEKYKNTYIRLHSHNYYELVYYTFGHGRTDIGDQSYEFSDNSFAVIPPGVIHDELHHTDSEVICLEFSGDLSLPVSLINDNLKTIKEILKVLLREAQQQNFGYEDMMKIKLNELYLSILRSDAASTNIKSFEYIINYIKENHHTKISLKECARQLNLSYDYFQHKFKTLTGLSPQRFLISQRLHTAEKLLLSGDLNCTEIAFRSGFSTAAQFSLLFKREYGSSPLVYRKTHA